MSDELANLRLELETIKSRLLTLEISVLKRAGVSTAVNKIVDAWPGPFTSQQIHAAVCAKFEDLKLCKFSPVDQRIRKLEKLGIIIRTHQGRGRVASIFERVAGATTGSIKSGGRFNSRHNYESGFRHIVRAAMASETLPKEFTLADLKKWMAENCPSVQVPYGSWSSTLYKLQNQGELEVAHAAHTVPLKVYRRGERQVMPSGDELKGLEAAWDQFKREFPKPDEQKGWSEAGSILQRSEEAAA